MGQAGYWGEVVEICTKSGQKGSILVLELKFFENLLFISNFTFQFKIQNSPSAHVYHSHKRRWYIYITYRSHSSHKIQDVRICLNLCLYILTQQRKLYTWGIS